MPDRSRPADDVLGLSLDLAAKRRDRLAAEGVFGADRVFPAVTAALLDEVPPGATVLEVGAATGVLTGPLLRRAGAVTALEISAGMLVRLLESEVAADPALTTVRGIVEDLPRAADHEVAVVTFTPRRGQALVHLLLELAARVTDRVVMLLEDSQALDWAFLARSASAEGFDVRMRMVSDEDGSRRAVILVADVANRVHRAARVDWGVDARETSVPYPMPRGTAARLIRHFMSVGDRLLRVRTDPEGVERLYGNLRTAASRSGAEVSVHRSGDDILLVRMPPGTVRRSNAPDGE